ncbi:MULTISPECIES: hypothetical protein [unclassified Campylobacter]|uniref:hypothetical protein n=1 Tax=unclassified Campylobacter TaxID=2593542 RepID=UPI0022E9B796|nr:MULTISPECIES: hypothetical protein [unclassified Campylobacter]MDA3043267.1 hypothetical protein [Campylobacter sp. JMF_09 ED2]MDA3045044.1 hypothetical protein [Campylobacter sp. JMF_07 ED4]MDA3064356.1 hypothetical protein [Campylobacter sp. JMF_11 EL3]MDA3071827.1 hypothetical protein [Campylobacter sp. VBCF_03 NA9]MDA3075239.1 hypothetical protein [Campylobacter sp. JMF_05 ED3]
MNDLIPNLDNYKNLQPNDTRLAEFKNKAQEAFAQIALKIEEATDAIKYAKELSREAENTKNSSWYNPFSWGNDDKKMNLTAKGLSQTNEAVARLNEIQQSSLKLIQGSITYTKFSVGYMAHIIANRSVEIKGKVTTLSNETTKVMEGIYNDAQEFVNNLMVQHTQLEEQKEKININATNIAKNSKRLDEKDMLDDKQSKDIRANAINISSNKTRLDEKDSLDTEQSRQIAKLESEMSKLKNNGLISIVSLIVSVLALGIAIFMLLGGKI